MAKRRSGSRPASRTASEAGDDVGSMSGWSSIEGRSTGSAGEVGVEEFTEEPFEHALEALYEKRTSARESALARLVSLLSVQWQYEECALREETLFQSFLRAVRRGKGTEARLGARALGLFIITLGPGPAADRMFKEALTVLEPILLTGRSAPDRVAAIDALCMLCFVGAEAPEETLTCMELLARVYSMGSCPEAVQSSALRAWSMLLTTVPAWKLNANWVENRLATLGVLLRSTSVPVRAAAGEAVSLLFDVGNLSSLAEATSDSPPTSPQALSPSSGRPPRPRVVAPHGKRPATSEEFVDDLAAGAGSPPPESEYSAAGMVVAALVFAFFVCTVVVWVTGRVCKPRISCPLCPIACDDNNSVVIARAAIEKLEDIAARIQDLSMNRGDATRRSQKERVELRTTFRAIQNAMEGDDTVRAQKIKLRHGDTLVIDTLVASVQVDAFRRFLAEGFQAHMQDNPLLHEIFNFTPRLEAPEKLTPLEKRLYRSPASYEAKARSVDRKKEREMMSSYKTSMLAHGDE